MLKSWKAVWQRNNLRNDEDKKLWTFTHIYTSSCASTFCKHVSHITLQAAELNHQKSKNNETKLWHTQILNSCANNKFWKKMFAGANERVEGGEGWWCKYIQHQISPSGKQKKKKNDKSSKRSLANMIKTIFVWIIPLQHEILHTKFTTYCKIYRYQVNQYKSIIQIVVSKSLHDFRNVTKSIYNNNIPRHTHIKKHTFRLKYVHIIYKNIYIYIY